MENQSSLISNVGKVKLIVSYGGKILSRPTDRHLSYLGGENKILAVDRRARFREIAGKLNSLANRTDDSVICVKYQLPGEDLDALISLIDDEDVAQMMVEYDRAQRISDKPARLRLFIFDSHAPVIAPPPANPDYLFGFDKEYRPSVNPPLDLLQIPRVDLAYNHGRSGRENSGKVIATVPAAICRVPDVSNRRGQREGKFPYGLVPEIGKLATGSNR